MVKPAMVSTAFRTFSTEKCPNHYVSDDTSVVPRISLDDFYASVTDFTISDEEALKYMTFAAKMAMVRFKDEEEMLDFKGDFQAALAFIQKLDDVDVSKLQKCMSHLTNSFLFKILQVKGEEPLGNVLEFYGGNDSKMRNEHDFMREDDD